MKTLNKLIFLAAFVCIMITTIFVTHTITVKSESHKVSYLEYVSLKEAELQYWSTKAELVDAVNDYIHIVAPNSLLSGVILVDECREFDIDIKLALAQGHQESHFGTQGLAAKTNSIWNVGAFDSLTYDEIHKKHVFSNPNQSIKPYLELLTTKYLTGNKTEEDLLQNFVSIDGKRYASSSTYETLLTYKYEALKATKIDSLQESLNYWTIKSNRQN